MHPRDEHGRFTDGGSSGSDSAGDAPSGEASRDAPEDIIFYKYTGGRSSYITAEDFKSAVAASDDYGTAQKARDDSL